MYYFYMGSVLLPIAPEKFTLKIGNANKTMTLINEGEINFIREAKLTELEFDVLIPAVQYSFAKYDGGFKSPAYFTDHFESLKTSKEPFQFIVSRQMPNGKLLFDNNMTVSMESYTIKEDVKNAFDLTVSIKLKQYRPYATKIVKVSNATASVTPTREQSNSPAPKQETTYTVKSGDTLWNIAKEFYGNGSLYTAIYEANKDKITNPNLIQIGMVLKIPNATSATDVKTTQSAASSTSSKPVKKRISVTFAGDEKFHGTCKIMYVTGGKSTTFLGYDSVTVEADVDSRVEINLTSKNGYSFDVVTGAYLTAVHNMVQGKIKSSVVQGTVKADTIVTVNWKE